MASQYDAFAEDYDWLFSDRTLAAGPFAEQVAPLLADLPTGAAILDCACGTGRLAARLAGRGYRVAGCDASQGMIAQAKTHVAEASVEILLETCTWEALLQKEGLGFDLVLCLGNSIGHCRDEDEMVRSLCGMRAMLKPGGRAAIHSRHWEKVLAERVRLTHFGVRLRQGQRCIPLYIWTFPDKLGDPLVTEVVLVFEQDGKASLRSYLIQYYPFRQEQLVARLQMAGFVDVRVSMAADEASYLVVGKRQG